MSFGQKKMKRNKAHMLGIAFVILLGAYVGCCLRAFFVKPPLEFGEVMGSSERKVISDWYAQTSQIRPLLVDFESVTHALSHPILPNPGRPSVTYGGLGGEGSIQFSYEDAVAIFEEHEGILVLACVLYANDAEQLTDVNRPFASQHRTKSPQ